MAGRAPELRPCGAVSGVGSLPFRDPDEALEFVRRWSPELPYWPQLPQAGPSEEMIAQFAPPIGFCDKHQSLSNSLKNDWSIPAGLAAFSRAAPWTGIALRGQVTGPVTLSARLPDVAPMALAAWVAKLARMQAGLLGRPVLITVDEPLLAMGGEAADLLQPVFAAIRAAGGAAGLHTCAEGDWDGVLALRPDAVSFDAARFLDGFLGASRLDAAMEGGLVVAWGVVPTTFAGDAEELAEGFVERLRGRFGGRLRSVVERSVVTPACGLGLATPAGAAGVMSACHRVAQALRSATGLST